MSDTSLTKQEPVIVGHAVTWVLLQVGAYVVGHTHLVSSAQWSAGATMFEPVISAVVLAALGSVIRSKVTPAVKRLEAASPALMEQVRSELEAAVQHIVAKVEAPHPSPTPAVAPEQPPARPAESAPGANPTA